MQLQGKAIPSTDPAYLGFGAPLEYSLHPEQLVRADSPLVFDPNSLPNILWNLLIISIIYYYFFEVGFVFFFGLSNWQEGLSLPIYVLNWVFIAVLVTDILISLFKGVYVRGQLVRSLRKTQLRYLRFYGWIDILFLLSVVLPISTQIYWMNYFKVVLVLKLPKQFSLRGEVIRRIEDNNFLRVGFLVVLLTIDIFLISHYIACIFYAIDYEVIHSDRYKPHYYRSWLLDGGVYPGNLTATPWYVQYLYAQGFGMGTLSTLAPGPAPMNPPEALYSIFVMMFCTLFIAFVGDALVQILYADKTRKIEYEDSLFLMNQFFERNRISKVLTGKIKTYYEFLWHISGRRDPENEQEALARLTVAMRDELFHELYGAFLQDLQVLKHFPPKAATLLLRTIKEVIFIKDQVVYDRNRPTYCVYFGKKNCDFQIFLYKRNGDRVRLPTHLRFGFGKLAFMTGQTQDHGLMARVQTKVYSLARKDLLQVVSSLQCREHYTDLYERLLLDRDYAAIGYSCPICSDPAHLESSCPELFTSVDRIFVANKMRHIEMPRSERHFFPRRPLASKRLRLKLQEASPDQLAATIALVQSFGGLVRRVRPQGKVLREKQKEFGQFKVGANLSAIRERMSFQRIQEQLYRQFNLDLLL